MLRQALVASLVVLTAVFSMPSNAAAAEVPPVDVGVVDRPGGGATVAVRAEHSRASAPGSARATAVSGTPSRGSTCTFQGEVVKCHGSKGVWSGDLQCYVKRLSISITPESPRNGHTDGSIYSCRTPYSEGGGRFGVGTGVSYLFWAPSPGSAGAPMVADPVQVAELAIEQMNLAAPAIGMTPLKAGAPLLVGVDAWLWVDNAGKRGIGPITTTATAGPTTVRATAQVTKVTWDLGDGTTVICRGAGTAWSPSQGVGPSPTCGHRYVMPSTTQPGGEFTIRATAHWSVDWAGAGQSGTIPLTLSGVRRQEVIEVQVLQTR